MPAILDLSNGSVSTGCPLVIKLQKSDSKNNLCPLVIIRSRASHVGPTKQEFIHLPNHRQHY